MEWMLDIQLGRRNLSPIQRIAITEKYRPIYEKQARENQSKAGKEYGNGGTKLTENLPQALDKNVKKERNPTTDKRLSDVAGVSEKTYRMGAKILNSNDEDLKQRVLSGETAISTGYKELLGKNAKPKENIKNKDLLETNIRQRGIGNPNPVKLGRCIKELERIYGVEHGGNHGNQYQVATPKVSDLPTQEQLADMIGISVDTLSNDKK